MSQPPSRRSILDALSRLDLEWGVDEDAEDLADLLLRVYTPAEAMSWMFFHDPDLDGTPVALLQQGRSRDVFQAARRMVS